MRQACTLLILFGLMCAVARSQEQPIRSPDHVIPSQANADSGSAESVQLPVETTDPYHPRPEWIPIWAQQGNFHFARLDGGPIEPKKTANSHWGKTFTDSDREVLGNLYGKYGDRAADLITKADVNWVWLTWSVGYSWQEEAAQREQAKEMLARLHRRGIHVTAYMCATSIFWQSMFRNDPQSVAWVKLDPNGVPYRYSSGRDPFRFMADVSKPGWVALEEKRIGAAIDAGFDAIFLDNTSDAELADAKTMDSFMRELRRFIHQDKHSKILLLSNYGLAPQRTVLNRNMDVFFAEYFEEPGAWGDDWNVRNVRRDKYIRSVIPPWKPMITEYSQFRNGNRSTMFLSPRSEHLSIAESATFGGSYAWNMEGPFDDALIHGEKTALASLNAIGNYNRFLSAHKDIYHGAKQVANYLVVLPGTGMSFSWQQEKNDLYDLLAKRSVLYNFRLLDEFDQVPISGYNAVVIPEGVPWPSKLTEYKKHGGRVYVASGSPGALIDTMLKQPPACASLRMGTGHDILGNITRIDQGRALAIHVLNYSQVPASNLQVGIELGPDCRNLIRGKLQVLSPDASTSTAGNVQRSDHEVSFTLKNLDTYAVAILQ